MLTNEIIRRVNQAAGRFRRIVGSLYPQQSPARAQVTQKDWHRLTLKGFRSFNERVFRNQDVEGTSPFHREAKIDRSGCGVEI